MKGRSCVYMRGELHCLADWSAPSPIGLYPSRGRGAGSPKASPRSLTPGFSDQPRASLAAEGAQTRALWGQHSFSAFLFLPRKHPRSPGEPRAGGGPVWGHGWGTAHSGSRRGSPQSRVRAEHHQGPQPRSLGSACPRFGAVYLGTPGRDTKGAAGERVTGSCRRKRQAGSL